MSKIRFYKNNLYICFFAALFSALIGFGYLGFEVWGQVEDYRAGYLSGGGFFMSPHVLRYMVVHPVYEVSSVFGLDINLTYSWYLLFSALIVSKVWASVRRDYLGCGQSFSFLIVIPFLLLLVVNGRFIFGLLGLSFLLKCVVNLENERFKLFHLFLIFLGLLFSSVSSGVFFVGVAFLVVSIFDIYRRRPGLIGFPMRVALLAPMFVIAYFAFVFLQKNISYFVEKTGSILGILEHGFGFLIVPDAYQSLCGSGGGGGQCSVLSIFNGEARFLLAFIIFIFLILSLYVVKKLDVVPSVASRGLLISILGGVFGFTTLFSFVFVVPVLFLKKRRFR